MTPSSGAPDQAGLKAVRKAASEGAPWKDLAALLGVSPATLTRWKRWADHDDPDAPPNPLLDSFEDDPSWSLGQSEDAAAVRCSIEAIRAGRRDAREWLYQQERDLIEGDLLGKGRPGTTERLRAVRRRLEALDKDP